ncbi:hypothetical protein C8R47DRAFT_1217907 [Mycena vitilis]|nr:hypothetical protein C8R47DRAFT_1217907 [Mycena vitilis]
MIVHDPITGRPGMINGHAEATLVAAPPDDRTWAFEVPYPSARDVQTALTRYGAATQAEIGRQRRADCYQMSSNGHIKHVPSPEANASHVVGRTPSTLRLAPISLPATRPFRQPLPSIQSVLQASRKPNSAEEVSQLPAAPLPGQNTVQQSLPPIRALSQTSRDPRGETDVPRPFFLTHPVNNPPRFDTWSDSHAATEGQPRRIDTPAPPLRLLVGPPPVVKEPPSASSDDSMPPVSSKDPEKRDPPASSERSMDRDHRGPPTQVSRPSFAQRWAVSNARLERLHYDARRCAVLRKSPDQPIPKYVFAGLASQDSTTEKRGEAESSALDTDDMEVDPKSRNDTGRPFSGPRDHDSSPLTSLSSSTSSSQDALSAISADKTSPPPLATPTESAAGSTSSYFDCRSTHDSPPPLARTLSNVSENEHSPSRDLSVAEDGEQPEEEPPGNTQALVLHAAAPTTPALPTPAPATPMSHGPMAASPVLLAPAPTFNVDPQELDGYLTRIVRAPPTPSNHNWVLIQEWTRNQGAFLARLYTVENADVLALLRRADSLIRQHPEFLDIPRMRVNEFLDTDLVNITQYPDITTESCTQFANRLQRARDAVNAYSPGLLDRPQSIHDIVYIPVSSDGNRLRQLSKRALKQSLMYRYALLLIAKQHPDWFAWYTEVRRFVLVFIQYLDELFRRRRWDLDETLLHQRALIPPPYLHPYEYQRLRVLLYTFDAHGQDDVVRTIHKFLPYRFRDTETVAHFLFAGLLETNHIVRDNTGGFKAVSPRRAFTSFRELQRAAAASCA